jgi:hypothetical protein
MGGQIRMSKIRRGGTKPESRLDSAHRRRVKSKIRRGGPECRITEGEGPGESLKIRKIANN